MKESKPLQVKIQRSHIGDKSQSYWQTYTVPRNRATRVLDAIEYIQDELDPGLGYRRHICHNLVCQSCTIKVDGHARLTCQAVIRPNVLEIKLEPLSNYKLIRDLIVDYQIKVQPQNLSSRTNSPKK